MALKIYYDTKKGLYGSEITKALKIKDSGNFSEILEELFFATNIYNLVSAFVLIPFLKII